MVFYEVKKLIKNVEFFGLYYKAVFKNKFEDFLKF